LWVSTRDGALAELAWPRGTTSWRAEEIDAVGVCALGHDLLVTHRHGRVARWSANRTVLWELALPAKVAFAPVVHGGLVLVVDEEGGLHALGVQDGAERFRAHLHALPAPHAASDGTLILQERSGELHGFDLQERSVTWTFGLEGEVYSGPAVSGGRVYAASWAEQLVCISLKSGDELWSRDLGSAVTASPVVAAGRVWVVTEGGTLHGFDAEDGRELARHDASRAPIQAPTLPLGGRLIVAATDGTLVAYD